MGCKYYHNCKKAKRGSCTFDNDGFCIKEFKLTRLLEKSLLSDVQMEDGGLFIFDKNEDDIGAYKTLKNYQLNIEDTVCSGTNLYIYSANTGNGKTSWAIKLLISYISSIWYKCDTSCHALFINLPRYLLAIKDFIDDKSDEYIKTIKENVLTADIVVWDDIGTKSMTEYETENVLSIINARLDSGKCNIFTSNVSPVSLSDVVGRRLSSRIASAEKIKFIGPDLRGVSIDSIKRN